MSEAGKKRPVRVTRDDLYRQVWETPMSRLAAQYGISGNGLAKICDRLAIPYPPRGYWAKKAAGQRVVTLRLPPPEADTLLEVTINPTPSPSPPPVLAPAVQAQIEAIRQNHATIAVPEKLLRPHFVIAGWLAERERKTQDARREFDPVRRKIWMPKPLGPMDRRRHRILDALFKTLEKHGGKVKESERKELIAEMNGEAIAFQLREKLKQTRVPLTDEEKKWSWRAEKGWKQELQPIGRLVFSIKTYLPEGLRKEWLETEQTPMESQLPDIVAVFVAAGPLLAERTRQRLEEERQRRLAEQRRYEEERRRKTRRNRWRRLVEIAGDWRDAQTARAFLDALKAKVGDQVLAGAGIDDWVGWAEKCLAECDPINRRPQDVFSEIAEVTDWTYRD